MRNDGEVIIIFRKRAVDESLLVNNNSNKGFPPTLCSPLLFFPTTIKCSYAFFHMTRGGALCTRETCKTGWPWKGKPDYPEAMIWLFRSCEFVFFGTAQSTFIFSTAVFVLFLFYPTLTIFRPLRCYCAQWVTSGGIHRTPFFEKKNQCCVF